MGFFSLFRSPKPRATRRQMPVVRVAYRTFSNSQVPPNNPNGTYVYYWPFPDRPVRGQRVIVPTYQKRENQAVITGPGIVADARGAEIRTVTRLATSAELAAVNRKRR